MMWQDFVFTAGSMMSVMFLYPTLRDRSSQVPRASSVPSMVIGGAYAFTFTTLGMSFSALGAFSACTMWGLIAAFRSPEDSSLLPEWVPFPPVDSWLSALADAFHRVVPVPGMDEAHDVEYPDDAGSSRAEPAD